MMTANRVQRIVDQLARTPWPQWSFPTEFNVSPPNFRAWAKEDSVLLEMDAPGRELSDFEVSAEKAVLQVRVKDRCAADASAQSTACEPEEGKREFEFRLPYPVTVEGTNVVYRNGVLQVTVERPEADKPHVLQVKQG